MILFVILPSLNRELLKEEEDRVIIDNTNILFRLNFRGLRMEKGLILRIAF